MSFKEGLQKFNETLTKVISFVPNAIARDINHSSAALTNVSTGRGTPEDVSTLANTVGIVAAAVATDGATEVEAVIVTASRRGAAAEAGAASRGGSLIDRAAFGGERAAYWRAESSANSAAYGADDLARMRAGRAPIGADGHPMELHHADGTPNGGLSPMTRTDHRLGENYRKNHPWLFGN